MPLDNVPAELFVSHKDVQVFHVYRNDEIQGGAREYWYSFQEYGSEDESSFDIRELPGFAEGKSHKDILIAAIDSGHIRRLDDETVLIGQLEYEADAFGESTVENQVPESRKHWSPPSHWNEHPDHPVEDWQAEVANDDTRLGYVDWVNHEIDTITEMQKPEE